MRTVMEERFALYRRRQADDEKLEDYVNDLRSLVKLCDYKDQESAMLRDYIVFGMSDDRMRLILLKINDLTLEYTIEKCLEVTSKSNTPICQPVKLESHLKDERRSTSKCRDIDSTDEKVLEVYVECEIKHELTGECDSTGERFQPKENVTDGVNDYSKIKVDNNMDYSECNIRVEKYKDKKGLQTSMKLADASCVNNYELKKKMFKITNVKLRTNKLSKLADDVKEADSKNSYMCENCNKVFQNKSLLEKHLANHLRKQKAYSINIHNGEDYFNMAMKEYSCNLCNKTFFIRQSLHSHMLMHRGEKPHKCTICSKKFSTKGHLTEHTIIHEKIKPHKCDLCSKCFHRKWNLLQHRLRHKPGEQHSCKVCGKKFAIKDYLRKHLNVHLNDFTRDSFYCQQCDARFTSKQFFDKHQLNHKAVRGSGKYQCTTCCKILSGKRALEYHIRTHTGFRPHQCHVCSKCFSQKGSLNLHLLTHSGERPHKCNICGKGFQSKDYMLKKHMLMHTGEKPYCCESCGKRFSIKSNLNKHLLTHKNDKPHKCDICSKGFIRKQHLHKHSRLHDITILNSRS